MQIPIHFTQYLVDVLPENVGNYMIQLRHIIFLIMYMGVSIYTIREMFKNNNKIIFIKR